MNAVRRTNVYPLTAGTSTSTATIPTLSLKWATFGGGDGGMDDILRRLHTVETTVSDIRTEVSALTAVVPHLATKADLAEVRGSLEADIAEVKGSLEADIAEVKGNIAHLESALIKWIVGTSLAVATLAFAIARFVAPAGS
jgi:hypothetical protein